VFHTNKCLFSLFSQIRLLYIWFVSNTDFFLIVKQSDKTFDFVICCRNCFVTNRIVGSQNNHQIKILYCSSDCWWGWQFSLSHLCFETNFEIVLHVRSYFQRLCELPWGSSTSVIDESIQMTHRFCPNLESGINFFVWLENDLLNSTFPITVGTPFLFLKFLRCSLAS
jgi:hypothetical protein